MRILIGMIICAVLSIITSSILPCFEPSSGMIATLYTVSGIMFSIGMSLVITFKTSDVKNDKMRNSIRADIVSVRDSFIACFSVITLLFILLPSGDNNSLVLYKCMCLKYSHLLVITFFCSIIYFVRNYLDMQKLNLEIEDKINQEQK